eukprot:Rmarinus@m.13253
MAASLPGFYFDPEKNRYFPISHRPASNSDPSSACASLFKRKSRSERSSLCTKKYNMISSLQMLSLGSRRQKPYACVLSRLHKQHAMPAIQAPAATVVGMDPTERYLAVGTKGSDLMCFDVPAAIKRIRSAGGENALGGHGLYTSLTHVPRSPIRPSFGPVTCMAWRPGSHGTATAAVGWMGGAGTTGQLWMVQAFSAQGVFEESSQNHNHNHSQSAPLPPSRLLTAKKGCSVLDVAWDPDGRAMCIGSSMGNLDLLQLRESGYTSRRSCHIKRRNCPASDVTSVAFVDECVVIAGSRNGRLTLWDHRTKSPHFTSMRHKSSISHLESPTTLSTRGGMSGLSGGLLACSVDGVIQEWDLRVEKPVSRIEFPNTFRPYRPAVVTAFGTRLLFAGAEDGVVRGWDLIDGELIFQSRNYVADVPPLVACGSLVSTGLWVADSSGLSVSLLDEHF